MRLICSTMMPAVLVGPVPQASTNLSRPISRRVIPSLLGFLSTFVCVAMPAWSVPKNQRVETSAHAVHADDGVLDGVVGRMAHMELAGHVRRRNRDGAVAHALTALVVAAVEPLLQDRRFVREADRSSWASLPYISPCPGVSACLVFARSGPGWHEEPSSASGSCGILQNQAGGHALGPDY